MSFPEPLEALIGLFIVGAILFDVFLSIIVPRRAPRTGRHARPSRYLIPGLWARWRGEGWRIEQEERREAFLGSFGALAVIVLLISWIAGLILGYGLLLHALRDQVKPVPESLGTALYLAGTSLLTIGFGDYVPIGGLARLVSLVAGATGLGIYAVTITLLYSLYGSFQRREVAVVVLEAGAGAPPSGVTLLETYAHAGIHDDLPRVFQEWQVWAAEVLDTHLAYPALAYFRSSHTNDSWISSLGAVMDAATLVITTIDGGPTAWAKMFRAVGGHCVEDLVQFLNLADDLEAGVEREEFEVARLRLERAGFRLHDANTSWNNFTQQRMEYAGRVNALARHFATPPAQWIGDRSPLKQPRAHAAAPPADTTRPMSVSRRG